MTMTQNHKNRRRFMGLWALIAVLILTACAPAETPAPTPQPTEAVEAGETDPPPTEVPPTATPLPTSTPDPTATPEPTATPMPTETPAPTDTPEPSPTATQPPAPTATEAPETEPDDGDEDRTQLQPQPQPQPGSDVVVYDALTRLDDPAVAPPLTVLLSANHALEGYTYRISGLVRNDGSQNYAGLAVIATFLTDEGRRHGPIRANVECPVLAPGEVCPFILDATAKDLTQFFLHPEGYPTERPSSPINAFLTGRYVDGVGFVHLTGRVENPNPFPIKNVTVNGALLNARGEIVSLGTDLLLAPLEPGATASFDAAVRSVPYAQARLFVKAENQ
jgi:hypothetical protein